MSGFEWGLSPEDLDDSDPDFNEYIAKMYSIFLQWNELMDEQYLEDMLYEEEEDDE